MALIADSFNVPTDLHGLARWMEHLIKDIPRHWSPKNPEGPNEEDVIIIWSCIHQRLEQLGVPEERS